MLIQPGPMIPNIKSNHLLVPKLEHFPKVGNCYRMPKHKRLLLFSFKQYWTGDQEVDGSDDDDDDDQEDDHEELAQQERERAAGALGGLNMDLVDEDHLDYELIVSLILFAVSAQGEQHLGLHSQDEGMMAGGAIGGAAAATGSVLVFMPGTGEIDRLCRQLEHATEGGQGLWVLPLHGSLPPQKQRAVFDPAPRGMRKIVVSTNIAETSITIPDVTVVVDSCRVKEMGYDVARQMPRLQEAWASQDSLTQRKGRAGRVREGVSFKLIRRRTFARLPAHGTPEIRRVPLDPLVLQIKALGVKEHPSVVLARALDPPDPTAVQDAVDTLTELKALGEGAVSCVFISVIIVGTMSLWMAIGILCDFIFGGNGMLLCRQNYWSSCCKYVVVPKLPCDVSFTRSHPNPKLSLCRS